MPQLVGGIGAINPTTGFTGTLQVPTRTTITSIAVGPDKNLWFTESGKIGEVNLKTLAVTEYPIPTPNSQPQGITAGPDGEVWFTETGAGKIGKIDPTTHVIVDYPLTTTGSAPGGIAVGSDGDLWFTEVGSNKIGEFDPTTNMLVGEYTIPTASSGASSITAGPGGLLYFTETGANQIGSIDPTTHAFHEYANGGFYSSPLQITAGPDGNLYFTEVGINVPGVMFIADAIGKLDATTHAITNDLINNESTTFDPTAFGPRGITTGPDGNLWSAGHGTIDKAILVPPTEGVLDVRVFRDPLGNGVVSGGPLAGYTVYLDANLDGFLDAGDPTAVTDTDGDARFVDLIRGAYTVNVVTSPGDLVTVPAGASPTAGVVADQITTGPTFGIFLTTPILPLTFNPTPFGAHNPDVSTAEVNGLYQILFNRAPDPAGLTASVNYLKGGGSLPTHASILMQTDEYQSIVIQSYY